MRFDDVNRRTNDDLREPHRPVWRIDPEPEPMPPDVAERWQALCLIALLLALLITGWALN